MVSQRMPSNYLAPNHPLLKGPLAMSVKRPPPAPPKNDDDEPLPAGAAGRDGPMTVKEHGAVALALGLRTLQQLTDAEVELLSGLILIGTGPSSLTAEELRVVERAQAITDAMFVAIDEAKRAMQRAWAATDKDAPQVQAVRP